MRDYMEIGSSPCDEACVQVDPKVDYLPAMRAECQRFLELIRKKLGDEPTGARLAIKSNPHDFGPYLEVVCHYDDGNEEATAYAHLCESHAPRTWADDQPLPKERYAVTTDLTVITTVEAESAHMAERRAEAQVMEKAQAAGLRIYPHDVVSVAKKAA